MNYRVDFHASALAQLHGLPPSAFDALVDRVGKLVGAPWDSQSLDRDVPAFRQCTFGDFGLLSFYVDHDREGLRIYDVTWAG
ncbi:hypothetical protein [Kribbella sp. NPDC050470]|uniref:hypothetical protein n=1 Tax=unclassified Kribbella TaxID=2644121 RepID=UPI0037878E4E